MGSQNRGEDCLQVSERDAFREDQIKPLFDADLATNLVSGVVKQAVEKMDKLREAAAKVLQRILYNQTIFIPFIPCREKLEEIIPDDTELKWGVSIF